jgi:hypothetical protein
MKRSLGIGGLLLSVLIWLLLSQTLQAASLPEHTSPALEAASMCISVPWMPRVSITRNALVELRERMAQYNYPTGVCITGPFEADCRAPESVEEAWLIEKLYGPPQRWVIDIVPLHELGAPSLDPGEGFSVVEVGGVTVGVLSSKTVCRLSVELYEDAIRVYELDT